MEDIHQTPYGDVRAQGLADLQSSFDTRALLRAVEEEGFSRLKQYKDRFGNCRVGQRHKEPDGYKLGFWVSNQRSNKSTLSSERRERLEGLGFVWHTRDAGWEKGFSRLKQYKERFGDCIVPLGYEEDGYNLGRWVSKQRSRKSTLSSERRERFEGLGFVWKPWEEDWEEGFSRLKQYKDRFGNCRVGQRHQEPDGYKLGQWVSIQRSDKSTLSSERRERLERLGFVWHARDADWEKGFSHLKQYKERFGNAWFRRDTRKTAIILVAG